MKEKLIFIGKKQKLFLKNPNNLFKSFSGLLEQFFLTVGQNNFGNKIPFFVILFFSSQENQRAFPMR